jgi:serine protease Do
VIQHDAVNLQPKDCGSPLIDLDGNVVAINIARAGRTETYAVPAAVVANVVEELKRAEVDNESTISSDEKPETEAELPTTRPAQ